MPLTEEERKEYFRLYYINNKKRLSRKQKEWFKNNKEKKAGYDKKYQEKNKELLLARRRKWWKENKDVKNAKKRDATAKRKLETFMDVGSCPVNDQCEYWCDGCECEQPCNMQIR